MVRTYTCTYEIQAQGSPGAMPTTETCGSFSNRGHAMMVFPHRDRGICKEGFGSRADQHTVPGTGPLVPDGASLPVRVHRPPRGVSPEQSIYVLRSPASIASVSTFVTALRVGLRMTKVMRTVPWQSCRNGAQYLPSKYLLLQRSMHEVLQAKLLPLGC